MLKTSDILDEKDPRIRKENKEVEFEKKEIKAMTGKEKIKDVMQINQEVQLPEIIGHKIYDKYCFISA